MKAATNAASKLRSICRDKMFQRPADLTDCSMQQKELMSSCCNEFTALQQGLGEARTTDKLLDTLLGSYKIADSLASILAWLMQRTDQLAAKLLSLCDVNDVYCSMYQECLGCLAALVAHISQLPDDRRKHFNSILATAVFDTGVMAGWPALLQKLLQPQQQTPHRKHAEQQRAPQSASSSPVSRPAVQQVITCWALLWNEWKRPNPFPGSADLGMNACQTVEVVQQCIQLLPQHTAAATSATRASNSGGSRFSSQPLDPEAVALHLACIQDGVLASVSGLVHKSLARQTAQQALSIRESVAVQKLLDSQAIAEAAVQQLAAGCSLLRQQLQAELEAALQAEHSHRRKQAQKQQRALQDIPAYHRSMLQQICPAADVYVHALRNMHACNEESSGAARRACPTSGQSSHVLSACCESMHNLWDVLRGHIIAAADRQRRGAVNRSSTSSCPLPLSVSTVQLSIELQLLLCAYSKLQLPWQTPELLQQAQPARTPKRAKTIQATRAEAKAFMDWPGKQAAAAMLRGSMFLNYQLFAIVQRCSSGSSSMHSILSAVLQQSGRHLLRALAHVVPVVGELWLLFSMDVWRQLAPIVALFFKTSRLGGSSSTGSVGATLQGTALRDNWAAALAAAHPEAYYGLIECCARSPLLDACDMLLVVNTLIPGALDNTAAAASLASAVVSVTKRMVKLIKAVGIVQIPPAAEGDDGIVEETPAAKHFPAAVPWFLGLPFRRLAHAGRSIRCSTTTSSPGGGGPNDPSSSGAGSPQQSLAIATLLIMVLSRSLVLLADAMEAAAAAEGSTAAQLFARSIMAKPDFVAGWSSIHDDPHMISLALIGGRQQYSTAGQWKMWQLALLSLFRELHGRATSGAEATAAAVAAASSVDSSSSSSCADHIDGDGATGTNSAGNCRWGYLLNLQGGGPCSAVAAAAAAFPWREVEAVVGWFDALTAQHPISRSFAAAMNIQSGNQQVEPDTAHVSRLYSDAIDYCRLIVAAAPLPLVCNNPACENLSGVSEASVAVKVCAGCHCRYCSPACQAADWKRHKRACRRMAAAGEVCA